LAAQPQVVIDDENLWFAGFGVHGPQGYCRFRR
jgi:hypothetical protein